MASKHNRYREMEHYMTLALLGAAGLFLLYLICAAFGVVWLKFVLAILAILLSGLCIVYLYLTKELLRHRSRWMSLGFASVILCILVSLAVNYPSPSPFAKEPAPQTNPASTYVQTSTDQL